MRVDIIDNVKALGELRADWDAVYEADPEAHFFLSWTWMSKWLAAIKETWFVLAARPDDGSAPVAFLPLWLHTEERKSGGFLNGIKMGGNYISDYTGFLCRPEFQEQAIPAFARQIKRLTWARLHLEQLRVSDHRVDLFMREFPESEFDVATVKQVNEDKIDNSICPLAPLPGDWDTYLDQLSANTRQKIRRLLRQIDKSDEFRITHAEGDTIERDLETLLRFWTDKWGKRKGTKLDNILKTNRRMLRHCFAAGSLFLPVLWQRERPVGVLATLVDARKRSFLFYMAGRDETFDGPPPGLALHAHSVRHAIRNGFAAYDFLRGNERYKYSFGVEERRITSQVLTTKSGANLGGRLDVRSLPFVRQRSMEHHRSGRHAEAECGFRQILELEPQDADTLYTLAKTVAKRGDHAEAIRLFKMLLADSPAMHRAWFWLGRSLKGRGAVAEAVGAYCEGIEREPAMAGAYFELAELLIVLGRFEQAESALDAVRGLQPDFPGLDAAVTRARHARGGMSAEELAHRASISAEVGRQVDRLPAIAAVAARRQRTVGMATTAAPQRIESGSAGT